MMGIDWYYQRAFPNITHALFTVLKSNNHNLSIAVSDTLSGASELGIGSIRWWDSQPQYTEFYLKYLRTDKQYLNAYISAINVDLQGTYWSFLPLVYSTLRNFWKDKDLVILRGDNGEQYQYDVYDTARSVKELLAPPRHAWDKYEEFKEKLLQEDKEKLFILAAGPVSKVLVYDLNLAGRRALDLGHLAKDYDGFKRGSIHGGFWIAHEAKQTQTSFDKVE